MDDPTRTERIRRILTAAKKQEARRGMKPKQSKVIVKSVLTDMIGRINRRTLAGKRDAAILQFGFFFGGRRRDEIANAQYRFLEKTPWGAFRYYLHHSKTDQTGKGLIEVKAKNTKNLKNWIKAANIHDGYLLRFLIHQPFAVGFPPIPSP